MLLELTSLGFVSDNIKEMRTLPQKLNIDDTMLLINFFLWMNYETCDIIVEVEGLCK